MRFGFPLSQKQLSSILQCLHQVHRLDILALCQTAIVRESYKPNLPQFSSGLVICGPHKKFFGPHAGALSGSYDLLNELKAYKVRPASNDLPYKFETGTQNHEGIAGLLGALEYFEWIGKEFAGPQADSLKDMYPGRRLTFKQALTLTRAYEFELSRALIETTSSVPGTQIYGLTDRKRLEDKGGMVRVGATHYNTLDEVARFGEALKKIAS